MEGRQQEKTEVVPTDAESDHAYRVVWHPEVHRRFNSALYFYLVAIPRTYFQEAIDQITSAFDQIRVHSFNLALVYGSNDILVRSWLTPTQRNLIKSRFNLQRTWTVTELECNEIDYLWAKRYAKRTPEDVALYYARIRELCEGGEPVFFSTDNETMQELYEAGLLLPAPLRDASSIKFYVRLLGIEDVTRIDKATRALHDCLRSQEEDHKINESTLHRVEDVEFLIKAVAAEFHDVYDVVAALAEKGRPFGLTSNTMLVAFIPSIETDHIDLSEDLGATLSVMCILLGDGFVEEVKNASTQTKAILEDLYNSYSDVFAASANQTIRECLQGLVRFAVKNDDEFLNLRAAGLWARLNYVARAFLPALLAGTAQSATAWQEDFDVLAAAEACGLTPSSEPRRIDDLISRITASEVLQVLDYLSRGEVASSRRIAGTLDARLPEGWRGMSPRLSELQIAFSKGEIFSDDAGSSALSEHWRTWAVDLLNACRLLITMDQYRADRQEERRT